MTMERLFGLCQKLCLAQGTYLFPERSKEKKAESKLRTEFEFLRNMNAQGYDINNNGCI